jgi:hypothetical protein
MVRMRSHPTGRRNGAMRSDSVVRSPAPIRPWGSYAFFPTDFAVVAGVGATGRQSYSLAGQAGRRVEAEVLKAMPTPRGDERPSDLVEASRSTRRFLISAIGRQNFPGVVASAGASLQRPTAEALCRPLGHKATVCHDGYLRDPFSGTPRHPTSTTSSPIRKGRWSNRGCAVDPRCVTSSTSGLMPSLYDDVRPGPPPTTPADRRQQRTARFAAQPCRRFTRELLEC